MGFLAGWPSGLVLRRQEEGRGPRRPAPTRRPAARPWGSVRASGGAELARGRAGQQRCGRPGCPAPAYLRSLLPAPNPRPARAPQRPGPLPRPRPHRGKPGQRPDSGLLTAGGAAELPPSRCASRAPALRVTSSSSSFRALPPEAPPTPRARGVASRRLLLEAG